MTDTTEETPTTTTLPAYAGEPRQVKGAARQETSETATSDASSDNNDVLDPNETRTDQELLDEGTRLCNDDQILPGARLLRKVRDKSVFNADHKEFLRRARVMETLRQELSAPSSQGWKKQGESHGDRDFLVFYKVEDGGKLKCRIESVIESSLYVPFLSVMNETQLYETWFPSWSFPFKLGINRSIKLKQRGRAEQVVQLTVDLPFPMSKREIVFWGFAEEDGVKSQTVGAKLVTVDESFDNGLVPPPEKGIVRMDFECDFLFRPCPDDHPALAHSKGKYPEGERKILLTVVMYCDPRVGFVPQGFLNFVTRNAIGSVWRMILKISEEVREGKRPAHAEVIASKREELYDWVEERARYITGEAFEDDGEKKEEEESKN